MATCVRKVLRLKKFASSLNLRLSLAIVKTLLDICIGEDSQACITKAKSPTISIDAKHIDSKIQLIGDHVRKDKVKLENVRSQDIVDNILTRYLLVQILNHYLQLLEIQEDS